MCFMYIYSGLGVKFKGSISLEPLADHESEVSQTDHIKMSLT